MKTFLIFYNSWELTVSGTNDRKGGEPSIKRTKRTPPAKKTVRRTDDAARRPHSAAAQRRDARRRNTTALRRQKGRRPGAQSPGASSAARLPRRTFFTSRAFEHLYHSLIVLSIFCALAFVVTTFFRVQTIEVRGNAVVSAEGIADAAGIRVGDKLLFVNRPAAASGIFKALPYVDTVRIRRRLPSTLVLEVTECTPAAALISSGVAYVIDDECKLLEYMPAIQARDILLIDGMAVAEAEPGKTIQLEDELRLLTLQDLLDALSPLDIRDNITRVNTDKLYDIYFIYDDRITVTLGDTSRLERKLDMFSKVLERTDPETAGTIDVSTPDTAILNPLQ